MLPIVLGIITAIIAFYISAIKLLFPIDPNNNWVIYLIQIVPYWLFFPVAMIPMSLWIAGFLVYISGIEVFYFPLIFAGMFITTFMVQSLGLP